MKSIQRTSGKVPRATKGILHVTAEYEFPGKTPIVATISLAVVLPYATTRETLRLAVDAATALCTGTFKPMRFIYKGRGGSVSSMYLKKSHALLLKTTPTNKRLKITK